MSAYAFVQPQSIQLGFPQYSLPYPGSVGLSPLYHPTQFSPQLQPYYSVSPPQPLYRLSPVLPQPVLGFPQPQYGTSLYLQYPQSCSTPSLLVLGQLAYPAALQQLHGQYQQTQGQFQQPLGQYPQPHGQCQQPQVQCQLAPSAVTSKSYRASPGNPQNAQHLAAPQGPQPASHQPQDLPLQSQPAPPAVTQHQHYAAPPVISQNLQGIPAPKLSRPLPTPPGLSPPHPRYTTRPVVDRAQLGQPAPLVDYHYHHAQGQPAPVVLSQHAPGLPTPPMNDQNVQGQSTPPVNPQQSQSTLPAHVQHPQGVPPSPRPPRRRAPPVAAGTEYRSDVLEGPKARMGGADAVIRRDPAFEQWVKRHSSTGVVEGSLSTYARRTVSSSHRSQATSLSTAHQRSPSASVSAVPQDGMREIPEDRSTSCSSPRGEHEAIQQESVGCMWPQISDGNLVYTVKCLLGEGSFGRVGKAVVVHSRKCLVCAMWPCATHNGREVAVKTFNLGELAANAERRDAYRLELQAWKHITQNRARWLMHLWSVFTDSVNSYMVMKLCRLSLENVVADRKLYTKIVLGDRKRWIEELVLGIEELHRLRIIHRDLKLDNILVDENGHIVITDFGLAEIAPDSALPFEEAEFYGYMGTQNYMAPEVHESKDSDHYYTCAADLWSLGVIIFEIFEGVHCFSADELSSRSSRDMAICAMHRRTSALEPRGAQRMILKLLDPVPRLRYRIEDVKRDVFFDDTDWDSVNRKTTSGWIPPILDTEDEDWREVLQYRLVEPFKHKSWKCPSSLFH